MQKKNKILEADEDIQNLFDYMESQKNLRSDWDKPKNTDNYKTYPEFKSDKKLLKEYFDEFMQDYLLDIREQVEEQFSNILEEGEFIKKTTDYLKNYITQQVNSELRDSKLHEKAQKLVKEKIETNSTEILKEIIKETIQDISNKMKKEYHYVKQLSYSIDSEIRHLSMKLPVSPLYEKKITERITEKIHSFNFESNNTDLTKKIEVQKNE